MTGVGKGAFQISRGRRIALAVVGAIVVLLSVAPPDFEAFMVVTGLTSDLDGGAHKLHIFMRGVGSVVTVAAGLVLIFKPSWAFGAIQTFIAAGVAYPVAGLLGLHLSWPPVLIVPIYVGIIAGVALWALWGRLPWQRPAAARPTASKPLLAAAAAISVPLIFYGLSEASLQRSDEFLHGQYGHWVGGTAGVIWIILLLFFAAQRQDGWRLPAWGAGFMLVMLGAASAAMPNQASSIGVAWGIIAVLGGVAYVALAEYESRAATLPAVAQPART
jgi:hypothetical protein